MTLTAYCSRRGFLKRLLGFLGVFISLNACSKGKQSQTSDLPVNLTKLTELKSGLNLFELERLALLKDEKGLAAVSLLCTHQTCLLRSENPNQVDFVCPCHGSRFGEKGQVLNGPAYEDLDWYEVGVDGNGVVQVFKGRVVDAGWRFWG